MTELIYLPTQITEFATTSQSMISGEVFVAVSYAIMTGIITGIIFGLFYRVTRFLW